MSWWPAVKMQLVRPLRYPLTIAFFVAGAAILGSSVYGLFSLHSRSLDRAQSATQRDQESSLELFSTFFDSSDGDVVLSNLGAFRERTRFLTPLMLETSYFRSAPKKLEVPPPSPPKSCFLEIDALPSSGTNTPGRADICAYAAIDRKIGAWINLDVQLPNFALEQHEAGQSLIGTDGFQVALRKGNSQVTYFVVFQIPPAERRRYLTGDSSSLSPDNEDRTYQMTAYRWSTAGVPMVVGKGQFEGWGYRTAEREYKRKTVRLLMRIDMQGLYRGTVAESSSAHWLPKDVQDVRVIITRMRPRSNGEWNSTSSIGIEGKSSWSLPSLYDKYVGKEIYSLELLKNEPTSQSLIWQYPSVSANQRPGLITKIYSNIFPPPPAKVVDPKVFRDGDYKAIIRPLNADAELISTGWAWISLIFLLTLTTAIGLFVFVFRPIFRMAREIRALGEHPQNANSFLSHEFANTEIGRTATAFNELLKGAREQTRRSLQEKIQRAEDTQKRHSEKMRARESMLRTVGHEIRSPLHALRGLHPDPKSPSRKYINRMIAAVRMLYGAASPEAAVGAGDVTLEALDIASYLSNIAKNAARAGIHDVVFLGPDAGIFAMVDAAAFEDAVEHILNNGDRFRHKGTAIEIQLTAAGEEALISISNQGPPIPTGMLEKIFEYGVSAGAAREVGNEHHGQGLFIARSYLHKMGATISARNAVGIVDFEIRLPILAN